MFIQIESTYTGLFSRANLSIIWAQRTARWSFMFNRPVCPVLKCTVTLFGNSSTGLDIQCSFDGEKLWIPSISFV
jgi:hypothetical protein